LILFFQELERIDSSDLFPNLMAVRVTTKVKMGSPALLRMGPIEVG
jgi:hypothetical protein